MSQCGRLELIVGNMFSGKTSELIRRITREKSINKKILVVNYFKDNRYSTDSVVSHDNLKVASLKLETLSSITEHLVNDYDSFFIDEAQFFPDLFDTVLTLVDVYKKKRRCIWFRWRHIQEFIWTNNQINPNMRHHR